jgi:autoinducer 2-degrading protein
MLAYCVDIWVVEGFEKEFIQATLENRVGTRLEQGNIRFDLIQSKEEGGKFFLFEVYENEEAVLAHKETKHYLKWRETVEPWMAQKRKGHKYEPCSQID